MRSDQRVNSINNFNGYKMMKEVYSLQLKGHCVTKSIIRGYLYAKEQGISDICDNYHVTPFCCQCGGCTCFMGGERLILCSNYAVVTVVFKPEHPGQGGCSREVNHLAFRMDLHTCFSLFGDLQGPCSAWRYLAPLQFQIKLRELSLFLHIIEPTLHSPHKHNFFGLNIHKLVI